MGDSWPPKFNLSKRCNERSEGEAIVALIILLLGFVAVLVLGAVVGLWR